MPDAPPPASVFVISPIGEPNTVAYRDARLVLEYIIRKALPAEEFDVVRADEETSPDSITEQVVRRIVESDFVIADLTDHNANVFYELAVAHGFGRPVVHLMAAGQHPPFDVSDQRIIFYDLTDPQSVDEAKTRLRMAIDHLAFSPDPSRNPVSAYRQFAAIEHSSSPLDANEAVADSLSRILARLARIEQQTARDEDASLSASATLPHHGITSLDVGKVISHREFGTGTVIGVSGSGNKRIAEVLFESVGLKRLLIRVAPIERL